MKNKEQLKRSQNFKRSHITTKSKFIKMSWHPRCTFHTDPEYATLIYQFYITPVYRTESNQLTGSNVDIWHASGCCSPLCNMTDGSRESASWADDLHLTELN